MKVTFKMAEVPNEQELTLANLSVEIQGLKYDIAMGLPPHEHIRKVMLADALRQMAESLDPVPKTSEPGAKNVTN